MAYIIYLTIRLACVLIPSIVFGYAVQTIIDNKGYSENWFWWGFFFGWIALIIALTKPNIKDESYNYESEASLREKRIKEENAVLANGGWRCVCGKVNQSFMGTCSCGTAKNEVKIKIKEASDLDNINKLKDLLNAGVITQEEFDTKKKEILNI